MTEERVYEIYCSGCPNENECHESCDYCEMVLEVLEVNDDKE